MIYEDNQQRLILEFGKGTILLLTGTAKVENSKEEIKVLGFKDVRDNPKPIGLDVNGPPVKLSEADILCVFPKDESLDVFITMLQRLRNNGPGWTVVEKNTSE